MNAHTHIAENPHHAAIRAAGHGDKLASLLSLLNDHRATLIEAREIAARHAGDFIFDRIARSATQWLRRIDAVERDPSVSSSAYGHLGLYGENGHAPIIEALLSEARFHDAERAS